MTDAEFQEKFEAIYEDYEYAVTRNRPLIKIIKQLYALYTEYLQAHGEDLPHFERLS